MSDKCPKCGIEGTWYSVEHKTLRVQHEQVGYYAHPVEEIQCVRRQLAQANKRIAELEAERDEIQLRREETIAMCAYLQAIVDKLPELAADIESLRKSPSLTLKNRDYEYLCGIETFAFNLARATSGLETKE